jgi:hypothetical protein
MLHMPVCVLDMCIHFIARVHAYAYNCVCVYMHCVHACLHVPPCVGLVCLSVHVHAHVYVCVRFVRVHGQFKSACCCLCERV